MGVPPFSRFRIMQIVSDIRAIVGGFAVTLKHMLRKPVTI
jgi:hypothetical protein